MLTSSIISHRQQIIVIIISHIIKQSVERQWALNVCGHVCVSVLYHLLAEAGPINIRPWELMWYCLVYYSPMSAKTTTTESWLHARSRSVSLPLCLSCFKKYDIYNSLFSALCKEWAAFSFFLLPPLNASFSEINLHSYISLSPGHLRQRCSLVARLQGCMEGF